MIRDNFESSRSSNLDRICISQMLNMGGGHHITREDYDVDLLISEIKRIQKLIILKIYIEPVKPLRSMQVI